MSYRKLSAYSLPFIITFLILAEKLYLPLGGVSIKFNLIIAGAIALILLIGRVIFFNKYQALFLFAFMLSVISSYNITLSSVAVFYFLISVVLIPAVYYSFLKWWGEVVVHPIMDAIVINLVISVVFSLYIGDRSGGVMYEPSYLSISLLPMLTWAMFNLLRSRFYFRMFLYLAVFLIYLLVNKSAIAILVLGLSVFVAILLSGRVFFWSLIFSLVAALSVAVLKHSSFNESGDLLFTTLYHIAESDNLYEYVESRAGNRFLRAEIAYDVFLCNPEFGVGPWAYIDYVEDNYSNHSRFSEFRRQPATNVFIELLASSGILSGLALLLILISLLIKSVPYSNNVQLLSLAFVMMFICMLFESNYLRPYWWLWYGVIYGYMLNERNNSNL